MGNRPDLTGHTSLSGERWVRAEQDGRVAWIPYRVCVGANPNPAVVALAEHGIYVVGKHDVEEFAAALSSLHSFPPAKLIDRPGWGGGVFALPDGSVCSPSGRGAADVVFERATQKCEQAGTLKAWRRDIAKPLAGQSIPVFALMLAMTGPLIDLTERLDNFGFELVGKQGCGKSSVQRLMASVLGSPDRYWNSWHTTLNALESELPLHADLTMILEEANLFFSGSTPAQRARSFQAFAFQLSSGNQKRRYNADAKDRFRLTYLSSSNEPLSALLGTESNVAKAAADRLITIPIPPDRPFGIFDSLPSRFDDSSAFIRTLLEAAQRNHGTAIRAFVSGLAKARAEDEAALRAEIASRVKRFQKVAGVDRNDGSQMRVAEAFGLVYAAGVLAMKYGVLPEQYRPGKAVGDCYRLSQHGRHKPPLIERLKELAARSDTVNIADAATMSEAALKATRIFVSQRHKRMEIWIRPKVIKDIFSDWSAIRRSSEFALLIVAEGDRNLTKRNILPNQKQEPFYCFRLPEETE